MYTNKIIRHRENKNKNICFRKTKKEVIRHMALEISYIYWAEGMNKNYFLFTDIQLNQLFLLFI